MNGVDTFLYKIEFTQNSCKVLTLRVISWKVVTLTSTPYTLIFLMIKYNLYLYSNKHQQQQQQKIKCQTSVTTNKSKKENTHRPLQMLCLEEVITENIQVLNKIGFPQSCFIC